MSKLDFAIYFLGFTSSKFIFFYEKKSDRQSDRHCDNMKACYVIVTPVTCLICNICIFIGQFVSRDVAQIQKKENFVPSED